MGEWLIAYTTLFGMPVQHWLLVAICAFVVYGVALALYRHHTKSRQ